MLPPFVKRANDAAEGESMSNRSATAAVTPSKPIAVITGGLGDIGKAVTTTLARDGFDCLVLDISNQDAGAEQCRILIEQSGLEFDSVIYAQCDVRNALAVNELISALPRLDVAVVNAAVVESSPFLSISASSWNHQIGVNLTGAFFTAQSSARKMAADGRAGLVVFMSSWVASRPWPEISAYSASKAALDQLMRQMALELAPLKIRALSIAPGIVKAGMAGEQLENEPQYAARAARSIPLGEPQQAQDIADAVSFLASSKSRTFTGSVLLVDSGCSLGSPD